MKKVGSRAGRSFPQLSLWRGKDAVGTDRAFPTQNGVAALAVVEWLKLVNKLLEHIHVKRNLQMQTWNPARDFDEY